MEKIEDVIAPNEDVTDELIALPEGDAEGGRAPLRAR